ncbi:glycosyltransferase, partial [Phocaeicola sartorii]|uniref:glycosyltransferase n=1 Tax=Phocaeicola sartorii TaxID=671267 RepID=UPI00259A4A79
EIKDDLSDLEEKLTYYISHPAEAEQIVRHAHEYVAQFLDAKRERLISLLVMDKYLRMTGQ